MDPLKVLNLVPLHLKTKVVDTIVESIAQQAEKLDPKIARIIRKFLSNATLNESFEKAIENAIKRFVDEYTEKDEDIVAAIQNDSSFWQSKTVEKALITLVSRPGAYLIDERGSIVQHFEDVLPHRINRKRVDEAVTYFLRCVAEELWTLPGTKEIRDVYSLQFQRISTEAVREQVVLSRKQLEATAILGKEVQQALLRFTELAEQHFLTSAPLAGELPLPKPYQNLIPKNYTKFIGREEEINKLMKFISPEYGLNIITVDGIGGVGKTSLVLEVAYRCLEASKKENEKKETNIPTFDAIIFTSAKQDVLTAGGILPRHQAQRTLHDIFQEISRTLDRPDITRATPEEQPERVRNNLARQKTLLIVDNLETIEDKQGVLAFLYELPANVKVVITTRERQSITPIRLTELPEPQGLQLIKQKASEMNITLTKEQEKDLYRVTGGIPAAIIYAIGQISTGYSVQTVLDRTKSATGDVARFCFQGSIKPIRRKPSHHILMAIAIFPKSPVRDALASVAGYACDPITVEEGLVRLQRLSLVTQAEGRYGLLPLTREYALAELAANPDFEKKVQERRVKWYSQLVEKYGGDAFKPDWYIEYDRLEEEWENIQSVLNWCTEQELYDDFKELWSKLRHYTYLYGYWNDRIIWINWLIQAAERRGDLSTLMEQLSEKSRALHRMGQLEEAISLYHEALKFRDYSEDDRGLLALYRVIVDINILQNESKKALELLNEAESIMDKIHLGDKSIKPEEREKIKDRERILILTRRAKIYYKAGNYSQAEKYFNSAIERANALNWQRSVILDQLRLAEVKTAKGEFNEAEHLLEIGFSIIKRNKDKRGIALYKCAFARLEKARDNEGDMRRWAREAFDDFERLGAILEADEMRCLLEGRSPLTSEST